MKMLFSIRSLFFVLTLVWFVGQTHALDKTDAGVFTLLDKQARPTKMQMRYRLHNGQWHMESRISSRETWRSICKHGNSCRLRPAKNREMRRWQTHLPRAWRQQPLDCVRNHLFAFCRTSQPKNAQKRAYWWFALQPSVHALQLVRK